jgi:hypothetical protein
LIAAVLAFGAGTADARLDWAPGQRDQSLIISCASIATGFPIQVIGDVADSEARLDPAHLPHVGDVFYGALTIGAVGDPCGNGVLIPEAMPPLGVSLAVDADHPIVCSYRDIATGREQFVSSPCARVLPGTFGGWWIVRTVDPKPWPLAYGSELELAVPLRSSRVLVGNGSPAPNCGRQLGTRDPPCPRRAIGAHLQWAVQVSDGQTSPILTPFVGVFVAAGPPSGDAPAIIAAAPRRVSARSLRRGVTVRLRPPFDRARIGVRLLSGGRTIALVRRTAHGTAPVSVRLRASAASVRSLRRRLELDVAARAGQVPPLSARRLLTVST